MTSEEQVSKRDNIEAEIYGVRPGAEIKHE